MSVESVRVRQSTFDAPIQVWLDAVRPSVTRVQRQVGALACRMATDMTPRTDGRALAYNLVTAVRFLTWTGSSCFSVTRCRRTASEAPHLHMPFRHPTSFGPCRLRSGVARGATRRENPC